MIDPKLEEKPVVGQEESSSSIHNLKTRNGVVLIPQPSDDPRDPLNWSQRKKYLLLFICSLSAFGGTASSLANQLGLKAQADLYDKTLVQMSYSISSAIAGIAYGPLFLVPLAQKYGRSSIILWSLAGNIACGIWSALMTGPGDYNAFVVARLFGGMFGACPSILGTGVITDIFFLHERGKAFSTFSLSFLLGTLAGPTFGGFIVQHVSWQVEFWWTVGFQAMVMLLGTIITPSTTYTEIAAVFCFLEETGFPRQEGHIYPISSTSFLMNRIQTFLPGHKVVSKASWAEVGNYAAIPIMIGVTPVTVLAGFFNFVCFGWFVMINTLLTVFLQEPVKAGGFAFTPQKNAAFTFALWMGVFAAQLWGFFLSDRIPLLVAKRRGGTWTPEYRLHSLWIPTVIFLPIGLGVFGAALQYHLHYMVLALGSFLTTFAAMQTIPVAVNYIVECFESHPTPVGTIMGAYRLTLGLAVPFFVDAWIASVDGPGWVFGMAALFSLFAFLPVILLIWKGHWLRSLSFARLAADEEGLKVYQTTETNLKANPS